MRARVRAFAPPTTPTARFWDSGAHGLVGGMGRTQTLASECCAQARGGRVCSFEVGVLSRQGVGPSPQGGPGGPTWPKLCLVPRPHHPGLAVRPDSALQDSSPIPKAQGESGSAQGSLDPGFLVTQVAMRMSADPSPGVQGRKTETSPSGPCPKPQPRAPPGIQPHLLGPWGFLPPDTSL